MRFAHVWSSFLQQTLLKGVACCFPGIRTPSCAISHPWLSPAWYCVCLCTLPQVVLGGPDLGLCIVCPPIHPKVVLHTSLRYPAGGGAAGDCQLVALTLWSQPLAGPGHGPFYILTQDFYLVLSVAGSGDPVARGKESLGGRAQSCLPSSFLHPGCCFGPAATPNSLLSGRLPCSPPAHAFYYQETCTHFNPRAGASGARMDE